MALYAYKGRNARGDLVQGRLEAQSAGAVADQLLNVGVSPVDIAPARDTGGKAVPGWIARYLPSPVGLVDVMLFSRQMHTLLKAGVPILRALNGIRESSHNPSFATW